MTQLQLREFGFRWTRPTWERTADGSYVLIVPSTYFGRNGHDPAPVEECLRFYEIFEFDGSWLDELHERQVERILRQPEWRCELQPVLT